MEPPNFLIEYSKSMKDVSEIIRILGQDCTEQYNTIQKYHNQSSKRAYIRSVFALIEGVLHHTKAATSNIGVLLGKLTLNELVVLDGTQLEINENGEVDSKPFYPAFLNNFKFTFKIYSKSLGSQFNLNLTGQGWQNLRKSIKLRNQLMHPKNLLDLDVSDEEINDAKKAAEWFLFNHSLCGYYAQKALNTSSTSAEDVAALDANIRRIEAELNARGN